MILRFKQRLFSWLDSYDVYDEWGEPRYTVKGQLSWGHLLKISDAEGRHVGTVKQRVFSLMPKFDLYLGDTLISTLRREFTFFKPRYRFEGGPEWQMEGNFWEWDYTLRGKDGSVRAQISKELWNWTDTYSIDVTDPGEALFALMAVIAIDAEKCSRNND